VRNRLNLEYTERWPAANLPTMLAAKRLMRAYHRKQFNSLIRVQPPI
jgi:hypothetical protein